MSIDCSAYTGETLALCQQFAAQQNASLTSIAAVEGDLADSVLQIHTDSDTFFILWAAALVFFMHAGFAMLSAGAVRTKNTVNILLSIVMDATICCIAFYCFGWAFAYGEDAGEFIGTSQFFGVGMGDEFAYHDWFFQFAFAATAATIVSGSVAERARFEAYLSYSFFLSCWVYPVVVHWVWGGGFLTVGNDSLFNVGAIDFAGCGPVHMIGGVSGAIASKIMGARKGRFDMDGNPVTIPGHSGTMAVLGTFILWVGWFGFNPGSALVINGSSVVAARAAVNTMLSSATGAIFSLSFRCLLTKNKDWDLTAALNGLLGGLVSITAGCSVVDTYAALIIGAIGGVLYIIASDATIKVLRIDDPLDATAVHAFCGMWGLIAVGLFGKTEFVAEMAGLDITDDISGIFYGGNGSLLMCQIIEILVVFGWVLVMMTPYFLVLQTLGVLRVNEDVELEGLDQSTHGGDAYPELAKASEDKALEQA